MRHAIVLSVDEQPKSHRLIRASGCTDPKLDEQYRGKGGTAPARSGRVNANWDQGDAEL